MRSEYFLWGGFGIGLIGVVTFVTAPAAGGLICAIAWCIHLLGVVILNSEDDEDDNG